MISIVFSMIKMSICLLVLLVLKATEYIEFTDALVLGFLTWLISTNALLISSNVGIVMAVIVGIGFLFLFHTKVGWWISTVVFSLMWASIMGWLADELLHVSTLWHWVVVVLSFLWFVRVHQFVVDREQIKREKLAEASGVERVRSPEERRYMERQWAEIRAMKAELFDSKEDH